MRKSEHWREGSVNLINQDNYYLKEKIREIEKCGLTIKERLEILKIKIKG
jgi:hypothetical protein